MAEMYGHRWSSQQGDEPNDSWIRGIGDLGNDQIARGLSECLNLAHDWPPTLPEFRRLCLEDPGARNWETQAHKIFEPDRLLEDKTSAEERRRIGLEEIAKLKRDCGWT